MQFHSFRFDSFSVAPALCLATILNACACRPAPPSGDLIAPVQNGVPAEGGPHTSDWGEFLESTATQDLLRLAKAAEVEYLRRWEDYADRLRWVPSREQSERAVAIADSFVLEGHLSNASGLEPLSGDQFVLMEKQISGLRQNSGALWIRVDYFDPAHFPKVPGRTRVPVVGGYPAFFSVSIDAERWSIAQHEASLY